MVNRHHLWYPRRDYKTALERKFRNLPCNIVELSVPIHNMIHAYCEPPKKPPANDMRAALQRHTERKCGC